MALPSLDRLEIYSANKHETQNLLDEKKCYRYDASSNISLCQVTGTICPLWLPQNFEIYQSKSAMLTVRMFGPRAVLSVIRYLLFHFLSVTNVM